MSWLLFSVGGLLDGGLLDGCFIFVVCVLSIDLDVEEDKAEDKEVDMEEEGATMECESWSTAENFVSLVSAADHASVGGGESVCDRLE